MKRMLAGLALLTLAAAAPVVRADELATGTRVRVMAPMMGGTIVGSLVASDAEALTLQTAKGDLRRVPRADLRHLDVSRKPSRRGRGALIGLAAGAVGGYIWAASTNPDGGCEPEPYAFCIFGGPLFTDEQSGAMGAVALGGIGAIVGALVAPGEKWERVPDSAVRVSLAPVRGGAAVRVSLRF